MNLLILPSWYPDKDNVTRGIFFKQQAEALQKYCRENNVPISITVFSFRVYGLRDIKSYLKSPKWLRVLDEDGVETWRFNFLNVFPTRFSHFYNLFVKHAGKKLGKCIKKIQYRKKKIFDLIHIHSVLNSGIIYNHSGISIPYILTEHSTSYARKLITHIQRPYVSECLEGSLCTIAVSKGLSVDLKDYTNKQIQVVFNMVKCPVLTNKLRKNSNFIFLSIGLGAYKKGFDILIQAFAHVWQHYNCSLIIGGITEVELIELTDLKRNCSIPDERCILLGKLPYEDVLEYMSECSCFILTSRFETFGIVYAEAMYFGKPVIGTQTGGPDSFITQEVGLTVKVEDIDETVNAMKHVIEHYSDYDSCKISEYAKENFSEEQICGQLVEIYKSYRE